MNKELLGCPFDCGSIENGHDPYIDHDRTYEDGWCVKCGWCEAAGTGTASEDEAIDNWNNRRLPNDSEEYKRGYYDCKKQFLKLIKEKIREDL